MPIKILRTAQEWIDEGRKVALATVSRTWGSAPFPAGSQLAADDRGNFIGSVSGGCIEGAVILEARKSIEDGKIRNLKFNVSDEQAWEVGLACGGTIQIFVEPTPKEVSAILTADKKKQSVSLVTNLQSGEHKLYSGDDAPEPVQAAMQSDKSGPLGGEEFIRVFNRPRRLAVVGAVHIAQELVPMARQVGFEVTVIDPREAFATSERFPEIDLSTEWPDRALETFELDPRCAVVTLTHDPKLDDPALNAALKSDCFYVGALGSTRTQAKRIDRLRKIGLEKEAIERIHGPIGLDIGAKSPAEIAVSILAEIVSTQKRTKVA